MQQHHELRSSDVVKSDERSASDLALTNRVDQDGVPAEARSLFLTLPKERNRNHLLGNVIIAVPGSWQLVSYFLLSIFGVAVVYLFFATYTRVTTVTGQIIPKQGVAEIVATRPGIIAKLSGREGDDVVAGAPLATIDVGTTLVSGGTEEQAEERALSRQTAGIELSLQALSMATKAQIDQVNSQKQALQTDIDQLKQQLDFQERLVKSASDELAKIRPLAEDGIVTQREVNERNDDLVARKQELSKLRQAKAKAVSDLQNAEQTLLRNHADAERQRIDLLAQKASLEKDLAGTAAQQSYVLTAPVDGTLTSISAHLGQSVAENAPLMIVLPKNVTLQARLSVPSSASGFIAPGQPVRLAVDAFPFESFGTVDGTISQVASAARIENSGDTSEAVYLTDVEIPDPYISAFGKRRRLVPGMTLTARIVTQKRSLFEWLFEPLYAISRR